ncbi:MAG: beta-glucosidase BglX [Marinoscillum sp.]
MKTLRILPIIISFLIGCQSPERADSTSIHDHKIDSLMALMTIEEKIGQLNLPAAGDINTGIAENKGIVPKIKEGKVGGLFNIQGVDKIRKAQKVAVEESRLGIPLLFAMDVIHGYKTVFPIPLGLSTTWDMALIEQSARMAAQEATADGIAWTFSPMTDITRDPRWGRVSEGFGEDPYLGGQLAQAMVRGYQGSDLSANNTMMACVKHFALYGAAEAGRDYNTVDMSRLRMYNDYLPPYKAAVDAGVGSVMASFNEIDGIPATGNKWLLTEVLRNQWGFDGFVVSDYTGINEMMAHGMGDLQQVSALALTAGNDMDMVGEGFLTTLKTSLDEGKISEAEINQACRRILEAKYQLGLFDDPYRYCDTQRAQSEIFTAENRKFARKVAGESFVLLKNEGILPLKKSGTIAVIGPLADNGENVTGTWSVAANFKESVSIYDGLKTALGDNGTVLYAKGANVVADPELEKRFSIFGKPTNRDDRSEDELIQEAMNIAKRSDVIVAVLGEAAEMSGESSSRSDISLPESQRKLLEALLKTGKPLAVVLLAGRPLAMEWTAENAPAILNTWFGGTEAGNAVADVLFGDVNPSGKLSMTFPRNVGQVPLFYGHKNTGRPLPDGQWFQKFKSNYLDVPNTPLYPFGFGLSYAEFSYGKIEVSSNELKGKQELNVMVPVTNSSQISGKEVVQLYIRDLVGSTTRPLKELKDFKKIEIEGGSTVTVTFTVTTDDLKFYTYDPDRSDQSMIYDWESGEFEIMIGTSSEDVQSVTVNWEK